jgi:hypothetical protein
VVTCAAVLELALQSEPNLIVDVQLLIEDVSIDSSVRRAALFGATGLAKLLRQRRVAGGTQLVTSGPSCFFARALERLVTWMQQQVSYLLDTVPFMQSMQRTHARVLNI